MLRMFAIVLESAHAIGSHWRSLLLALAFPAAAMFGVAWIAEWLELGDPIGSMAGLPFYALFAISCHRVIILGDESLPNSFGLSWSCRETRFVGWLVVLGFVAVILSIPAFLLAFVAPSYVASVAVFLFTTYFVVRLSLVLPGTAVDDRPSLSDSWNSTAGNGVVLLLAVSMPIVATYAIFAGFDAIFAGKEAYIYSLPYLLVSYILLAVEIGVLSVAYKHIVRDLPIEAIA